LAASRESQSISYDGYLVSAKPAASSHGASLKSSCCISCTVDDSGEADGDGDGHEDSAADSRQDEDASSEDGEEEQLLVGVDDDVAAAIAAEAGFLAPFFLDAAMFWQSVWSLASTDMLCYALLRFLASTDMLCYALLLAPQCRCRTPPTLLSALLVLLL